MITGRTLDADGDPMPGTGFEVDPEGDLGELIADRTGPITSHPTRPVWGVPLPSSEADVDRTLSVFGPGYDGPPEHYHERSLERFSVRSGEVVFSVDGRRRRAGAGDTVVVETGRRHTFGVPGDAVATVLTEIHDPGRLRYVLPTLSGLAHDAERDAGNPLQRAMIARRLDGNTVFTETDPRLTRPLARLLEPLARAGGYEGAYARYLQPAFWEAHVEQPDPTL
ncbi:cupin domain-containing protein [Halobacteriales archaeon QS_6_71_20]|nr:MAG: cupin domain-containing protein [Halobacteriales archaeon QS_6_71_20]